MSVLDMPVTECFEDELLPVEDQSALMIVANPNPSKFPVRINSDLVEQEQLSVPIEYEMIINDNKFAKTYSTVNLNFSLNLSDNNTYLENESKVNDNSDNELFEEKMNLQQISTQQSEFVTNYHDISNMQYTYDDEVANYIQNTTEFSMQEDIIFETENNDCFNETKLMYSIGYYEGVGANIEIDPKKIIPEIQENIFCEICDATLDDSKMHVEHISSMHM